MKRKEKTLQAILRGTSDANIAFKDLCDLLKWLGFAERILGDHFIYMMPDVDEILNVQPLGSKASYRQIWCIGPESGGLLA